MKKTILTLTTIVSLLAPKNALSLLDGDGTFYSVTGNCSFHGYELRLNCRMGQGCDIQNVSYNNMITKLPNNLCPPNVKVDYGSGNILSCFDSQECNKDNEDLCC